MAEKMWCASYRNLIYFYFFYSINQNWWKEATVWLVTGKWISYSKTDCVLFIRPNFWKLILNSRNALFKPCKAKRMKQLKGIVMLFQTTWFNNAQGFPFFIRIKCFFFRKTRFYTFLVAYSIFFFIQIVIVLSRN